MTAPSPRRIAEFDYELPDSHIAQTPSAPRDSARLLDATGALFAHRCVADLAEMFGPGDLVVVNNTRVLPARLHLRKPTGGAAEVLLLEPAADLSRDASTWKALVKPSRRIASGTVLTPLDTAESGKGRGGFTVTVLEPAGDGTRLVRVEAAGGVLDALESYGQMPLPPYITERLVDNDRYQTVYADRPGSAAAPTAGLHLTDELLDAIRLSGAQVAAVELVVGLDTFRPVMVDDLDDHQMHTEAYVVPDHTWQLCQEATRVVAVGTTTVRALESAAATGALAGRTDIFIRRPYPFAVVDVLLTNFHLPKSTLLVMIDAFYGPEWRQVYDEALSHGYRFLSFGDAMLLPRRTVA